MRGNANILLATNVCKAANGGLLVGVGSDKAGKMPEVRVWGKSDELVLVIDLPRRGARGCKRDGERWSAGLIGCAGNANILLATNVCKAANGGLLVGVGSDKAGKMPVVRVWGRGYELVLVIDLPRRGARDRKRDGGGWSAGLISCARNANILLATNV